MNSIVFCPPEYVHITCRMFVIAHTVYQLSTSIDGCVAFEVCKQCTSGASVTHFWILSESEVFRMRLVLGMVHSGLVTWRWMTEWLSRGNFIRLAHSNAWHVPRVYTRGKIKRMTLRASFCFLCLPTGLGNGYKSKQSDSYAHWPESGLEWDSNLDPKIWPRFWVYFQVIWPLYYRSCLRYVCVWA